MKRPKIIAAFSGIAIVGLGIYAVVQSNRAHSVLSIIAVVLALVPMYFLHSAIVLGKYNKKGESPIRGSDKGKTLREKKGKNTKKAANDYGKVLDFPADKQKKKDKK